jgi:hypothetical protein
MAPRQRGPGGRASLLLTLLALSCCSIAAQNGESTASRQASEKSSVGIPVLAPRVSCRKPRAASPLAPAPAPLKLQLPAPRALAALAARCARPTLPAPPAPATLRPPAPPAWPLPPPPSSSPTAAPCRPTDCWGRSWSRAACWCNAAPGWRPARCCPAAWAGGGWRRRPPLAASALLWLAPGWR